MFAFEDIRNWCQLQWKSDSRNKPKGNRRKTIERQHKTTTEMRNRKNNKKTTGKPRLSMNTTPNTTPKPGWKPCTLPISFMKKGLKSKWAIGKTGPELQKRRDQPTGSPSRPQDTWLVHRNPFSPLPPAPTPLLGLCLSPSKIAPCPLIIGP